MKKILSLLLVLITMLSLTSCSQAPKPKDKRVVLTLSGEKIYYDYFRYVFLNTKADMDDGDDSYWTENPEKLDELKESVLETLVHNRAIQLLAKKHKIKLSDSDKKSVLSYIESMKEYDPNYKEGMEEAFMSDYCLYYLQTFTTLWGKVYDYVTSPESGLVKNDDARVWADIPVNFRRIRYVMIEFDGENKEEKRAVAEAVLEKAQNGDDFVSLIKQYCDEPEMVSGAEEGTYYTIGQFLPEVEDQIEKLSEGQISGIVELPIGFFIFQRLPLDNDYIEDNFADFVEMYTARAFNEMVASIEETIKIKTSKIWDELSITDVK